MSILSEESIRKYQAIYKKEFGKEISHEEAREQGERLVGFFKLLYEIDKRNKNNKKNE